MADLDYFSMGIAYGMLRIPAMPEIKDWKRKKEVEKKRREKRIEAGLAVEDVEDAPTDESVWQDAEVDVS
jgi:ATP-dependent RNA helicase DDX55/SPB4